MKNQNQVEYELNSMASIRLLDVPLVNTPKETGSFLFGALMYHKQKELYCMHVNTSTYLNALQLPIKWYTMGLGGGGGGGSPHQ